MTTRKVTALKLQKRNKNRVNVYLDGEFAFGLAKIVAAWLKIDQELTPEKIAELQAQDEVEVALQRALNFLNYRPRTAKEIRDNLNKHKVSEAAADQVIERLLSNGLLNDTRFAEMWVENRSTFRPRGRRMLRIELRKKGIEDEDIETVLEELDEEELAYQAASKKARRYRELEWQEFRKKMSGFLSRRGFNYDIISIILPKVWEELDSQPNRT